MSSPNEETLAILNRSRRSPVALPARDLQAPDDAAAVVAVDVAAAHRGVRAAVDVAAGDRAAVAVAVLRHRHHELADAERLVLESRAPLVDVPAVVLEARTGSGLVVDLLDIALADVADVEVAVRPVEREAPGVAEAECFDLDALRGDVDREQLAEERAHVLRPVLGIAAGAAVAHREVEPAVRSEGEHAAVVVAVRVGAREELPRRARADPVRPVLDELRRPVSGRVLDVELAHFRVGRVEGKAEQSLLPARRDDCANVEERGSPPPTVLQHEDPAALLDDVQPSRLTLRAGDEDRLVEPARNRPRREARAVDLLGRGAGRARGEECGDEAKCEQRPHGRAR